MTFEVVFLALLACSHAFLLYGSRNRPTPGALRVTSITPKFTYKFPKSTHHAPASTYKAPKSTYKTPVSTSTSTYESPVSTSKSTYESPVSTSKSPKSTYKAHKSTSEAPSFIYQAPREDYASDRNRMPLHIRYDYSFNADGDARYKLKSGDASSRARAKMHDAPWSAYQPPKRGNKATEIGHVPPQGHPVPVNFSLSQTFMEVNTGVHDGFTPVKDGNEGYASSGGYSQISSMDSPPKYHFKFSVNDSKSGDVKSHEETRDGKYVQGKYSVLQPDGLTRTVNYHTDDWGFKADVAYA